ncbi:hypothetical protein BDV34DRAFT_157380 [Aspergillus parasiticus]|uniref:Nucleoside phosphorylase domain-containing protein n=1 Tax=Aspergillus parasiticus TaxID=5067 RepID=A0A5N6DAE4_ASPPA|nr:hypothetical protein BDV34DRAFT_157380 [Aspergillus parasiticus]
MEARSSLSYDAYTVGWICALSVETAAARLMLDEIHPSLPPRPMDQNTYTLGKIGKHNIVIASLPSGAYGTTSAATVAMQLLFSFPAVRFGFMVGIGGGVPSSKADIRLGDVVVSRPTNTFGGVIQYDIGRDLSGGHFERTGMLNRPPKILLAALNTLEAYHFTKDSQVVEFASNIQNKMPPHKAREFVRPTDEDCLFHAEYDHVGSEACINCDRTKLVARPQREHGGPVIHYGLIGSANRVVKDGRRRDQLARDLGIYCVEMEAAGLMNDFPCLVIRGICDYADSHKNKKWQGYAAVVAAAYAKELLLVIPADEVGSTPTAHNTLSASVHCFDIPLDLRAVPVVENFVGRQGELDRLWEYLQPTNSPSRKVAVLHGLGGIGKTQLAVRFARVHKHDFTAIFWLSGKDRGTLLGSLSSISCRLPGQSQTNDAIKDEEVEQRARSVLRWLALKGNSRWLIIFDNIDQYSPFPGPGVDYDIAEFFPAADHGAILITSRLPGLTEMGKSFQIQRLDSKNTIRLLLQTSSGLSVTSAVNDLESNPDTIALAKRLDGLPLAVVIAGAFMRQTGTGISEYLQYYQESWSDLQQRSKAERQYQQGNMLQTWIISYREIQKRDPDAASLLLLLACFDNRDIWYDLIRNTCHSSNVPVWLERTISSELTFKACVRTIIGFSLLEIKEQGGAYAMHPVVRDWCIHLAGIDEGVELAQLQALALVAVGYTVPSSSNRNYCELQRRLIPHANYIRHTDWGGGDPAVWHAFHALGNLYSELGKLKDADEIYQRALADIENAMGPNHPSMLYTANNLGNLYTSHGKLKEAEKIYKKVLGGLEKHLGLDHLSTLTTVINFGKLYASQGRLKEAEDMYRRALAGCEKIIGPGYMSAFATLVILNNLGKMYLDQGKVKEAEEMIQQALSGFENAVDPGHPCTLAAAHNLGRVYANKGWLNEAEKMYQRALAGSEKTLGPDHLLTVETINCLGLLYYSQKKPKEAEKMYQRALAGYEKALGPDHPSTLYTVNNLGLLCYKQENLKEAERMYQRALAGYEKTLGPDNPSTLNTVNNLGLLYYHQGKLKEAEETYQRALAGYENGLDPDNPSTIDIINNLGFLYFDQEKLKKAEEMYQRALAGYEKILGPDHPSTLNTVNNLGLLYYKKGKLKEAEKMHQRALTGYEKALDPDCSSTLYTVNNLDLLHYHQEKLKEVEEMYQRALAGYKALGPDHPSTFSTVKSLATNLQLELARSYYICTLLKLLWEAGRRVLRPRLRTEYRRLEWRCTCGDILYGDFRETAPGSIDRLAARLSDEQRFPHEASTSRQSSTKTHPTSLMGWNMPPDGENSDMQHPRKRVVAGGSSAANSRQRQALQLCTETGKFTLVLSEIDLDQSHSDGLLFKQIREKYERTRHSMLPMRLRFSKPGKATFIKECCTA